MKLATLMVTIISLLALSAAGATVVTGNEIVPSVDQHRELDRALSEYSIFRVPLGEIHTAVEAGRIDLRLGHRNYDLVTWAAPVFADGLEWTMQADTGPIVETVDRSWTYRAHLAADETTLAALLSRDDRFGARVVSATEDVFVQPLADFVPDAAADQVVVYRGSDSRADEYRFCGNDLVAQERNSSPVADLAGYPLSEGVIELTMGIEMDGEYIEAFGPGSARTRIGEIINQVNLIYEQQFNATFKVVAGHAWPDSATDPYTSNDIFDTLVQFEQYWVTNQSAQDVMHMFSAKNYNFGAIGIGFFDAACGGGQPEVRPFGISKEIGGLNNRVWTAAHQIGHNFSSTHDDDPVCPGVICNNLGPIMCSILQTLSTLDYSSCSEKSIDSWLNTHCVR